MKKRTVTILLILTLAFIWGNSMLSREASGAISDGIMSGMNAVAEKLGLGSDFFTFMYDQDGDGVEEPTSHIVRKMAHVTEFAVLGLLLYLRLDGAGRRGLTAFGLGAAAGAADELIQLLFDRGSQLRDVCIDAAGVLLGVALAIVFIRRRQNGSQSSDPQSSDPAIRR